MMNGYYDVYVKDLINGDVKLVSLDDNNNQPNDHARLSGITADGSSVSFTTYASNIDPDGDDGSSLFIAPTSGNQPTIFITSSGIVNVDENLPSDTVIYDANANDINGVDIVFSLSGDDASLLQIDPDDGEVRLLSSADYETKSSYDFNVIVSTSFDSVQKNITFNINDLPETNLEDLTWGQTADYKIYYGENVNFYDVLNKVGNINVNDNINDSSLGIGPNFATGNVFSITKS